jgi:hypothetical protein
MFNIRFLLYLETRDLYEQNKTITLSKRLKICFLCTQMCKSMKKMLKIEENLQPHPVMLNVV